MNYFARTRHFDNNYSMHLTNIKIQSIQLVSEQLKFTAIF